MKIFFFLIVTKEKLSGQLLWLTVLYKKNNNNKLKKQKHTQKNLVWILFSWIYAGMRWWNLGLLVKPLISKVLIYISCLHPDAFNTTTKGSPHSSVNPWLRAFSAFSYAAHPVVLSPACRRRSSPVHSSEQGRLDASFSSQALALKSAGGLFSSTEEENNSSLQNSTRLDLKI